MRAARLERDDPGNEVIVQAPVDSVTPPDLILLGVLIRTDGTTRFEDVSDTPLTAAEFFNQVGTGDLVKAKGGLAGR